MLDPHRPGHPRRALLLRDRSTRGLPGRGSELNPGYWADSVKYLEAEERKASMPSLFDLVTDEQVPA